MSGSDNPNAPKKPIKKKKIVHFADVQDTLGNAVETEKQKEYDQVQKDAFSGKSGIIDDWIKKQYAEAAALEERQARESKAEQERLERKAKKPKAKVMKRGKKVVKGIRSLASIPIGNEEYHRVG